MTNQFEEIFGFIRARLDEEEAAALAARTPRPNGGRWFAVPDVKTGDTETVALLVEAADELNAAHSLNRRVLAAPGGESPDPDDVPWLRHAARQSPRVTLARIRALRKLVEGWECIQDPDVQYSDAVASSARDDMEILAEAWEGHPDYRREWQS